jgi:hypothetical protein
LSRIKNLSPFRRNFVPALDQVTQAAPAVILGLVHEPGPDRVQVHVGQQVYQGFAFLDDYALEPLPPERAPAFLAFVVVLGEPLLDVFHEVTKPGQAVAEVVDLARDDPGFLAVEQFLTLGDVLVCQVVSRIHPDNQVEVVAHQAKAKQINEIDFAQSGNRGHQVIFLNVLQRKSVQSCAGHDVACPVECLKAQQCEIQLG